MLGPHASVQGSGHNYLGNLLQKDRSSSRLFNRLLKLSLQEHAFMWRAVSCHGSGEPFAAGGKLLCRGSCYVQRSVWCSEHLHGLIVLTGDLHVFARLEQILGSCSAGSLHVLPFLAPLWGNGSGLQLVSLFWTDSLQGGLFTAEEKASLEQKVQKASVIDVYCDRLRRGLFSP